MASYPSSKIANENVDVFANAWSVQINDLSVLVKDVNDSCHGKSDRQVYLSLPRPGVSISFHSHAWQTHTHRHAYTRRQTHAQELVWCMNLEHT